MDLFANRRIVIATKHGKEQVLAPLLSTGLNAFPLIVNELDTDQLGTFTGEVERGESPLATARLKCYMAMALADCDLAIASEGSFGQHPVTFFTTCNEELLLLVDKKNNLEIVSKKFSIDTNFGGCEVKSYEALKQFARKAVFPSHKLILKKSEKDCEGIIKGISSWKALKQAYESLVTNQKSVFVETDMRAMNNPTRMTVIAEAAQQLIEKVKSHCPKCNTPGFGIISVDRGLPCSWCLMPTASTLYFNYQCSQCKFEKKELNPNQQNEDPMFCDYCNP